MTTTLWSPHHPGLHGFDVDVSFTSLPQLATSLDDDIVWPSSDACSLLFVDVVHPHASSFNPVTASMSSPWLSDSAGPQHNQHVQGSLGDRNCWSKTPASNDDIQLSAVDEVSWSNGEELISSDEIDECLSHLLMTPQPGCHGNYNNVAANWQSEQSSVSPLADQSQPSPCDTYRLHLATSASLSNQEHFPNASRTTNVQSSTFTCYANDSDEGPFNFLLSFFHSFNKSHIYCILFKLHGVFFTL